MIFWRYTGPYNAGDRLVTGEGSVWRVSEVVREATPVEDGVPVVESWREEHSSHAFGGQAPFA